ncbi:uncharacterized protein LOC127853944 [Dreissena polymorpha]|uniref:Uncharacterized protein n=1 Tax=Dreissena polymorpha TaxID=45954 RepID=A0A9D4CSQ8_DREPO|nr:uncharacterized protein LOC127853944 [Dreissena polymorpha]KAH3730969.1 hypothetical protein DPMN_056972 [Dreissena polymorpha]
MTEKLETLQASLWNDITTSKTLKDEIKRLGNAIHDIYYKGNEEFNFIAEKKCLKKIQISEEYIESNSEKAVYSLIFKADNDIQKLLCQFPRLGWIECSNWGLTVKETSEYNMLTADDSTCTIKALCVRHDGMIIVADQANKKIKLLNQQYRIITHCDVSAEPQDVCEISFGEIAVAVDGWFTKEIQFIFELNGQLVNGRKLELQHPCYGISYHDGKLYITSSTALYKYSLCGKQESKIFEDTSAKNTLWKCAVSPTGTRVYITNQSQKKLLTVGMDGSVLASFTHPELRLPYGVHVTPAGKVLVCGKESTTVIQVDSGGKMKLATLASKWDGINFPRSVFYNKNTASIIVGHFGNDILVFRLV